MSACSLTKDLAMTQEMLPTSAILYVKPFPGLATFCRRFQQLLTVLCKLRLQKTQVILCCLRNFGVRQYQIEAEVKITPRAILALIIC